MYADSGSTNDDEKIGVLEYGRISVQSGKNEKIIDAEESLEGVMMATRNERFSDANICE